MSIDFKTDSRPFMTHNQHPITHRPNPSYDQVDWTYPVQYRPRGPNQSVPSAAHTPSTSISSTTTSHCLNHQRNRSDMSTTLGKGVDAQEVIARILERDAIPQVTYLASQRVKKANDVQEKKYPERIDSRRACLSMANGIKAPLLLRGPSHSNHGSNGRRTRVQAPARPPPVPKRTSEVQYLHKELPPTPPSTNSSKSAHSPRAASPSQYAAVVPERKAGLPMTRPLNLSISSNTLAAKRLSRAKGKVNGGSLALSRFRAVPAPIHPPRINGPSAFNGPSSANTTDDEFPGDADIEDLQLGEPLIQPVPTQQPKTVMTPMGELPITPLDIPVDWDDLHDRWTSPVAIHPDPEMSGDEGSGKAFVFDAFRQDVNDLFARSPTIGVRASTIEAGFSAENENQRLFDGHPFSCATDLSSEDSEGGVKKEKRHGKVLVKKELKLCLDMNVDFGENRKRRRSSKHRVPKAGESFLMMTSPLSPETASLRASILC